MSEREKSEKSEKSWKHWIYEAKKLRKKREISMDYLNLEPRTRNGYTPEMVESWFVRFGSMEAVAKYLGIQKASLSRIISRRQSLSDARARGLRRYKS